MSERSLRRKLASEGHSYARLLADHRQATVERLLLQGDIPLKQIALKLGYASSSSFHRAFRMKAGLTPLQWRRRELASSASAPDAPTCAGTALPERSEPLAVPLVQS